MKKHFNIIIYGRVQGIFFRAGAREQANKLDIAGFARNEPNGLVYIEAEGEKKNLNEFLKWCRNGPPLAQVEKIETTEGKLKNFTEFSVSS